MFGSKKWIPVSLGAAVTLALAGLPAQAQQATADTSNDQLEEVVVTGSLIRRSAAESAEAVTVLKAEVLTAQGVQTVEQALNMLTSNNPAINIAASVGTFSGGGTYADLRGLGDGRTLVLLDGQRLANNANTGDAVDLSGIPFSAIDRIEVLREGASAEYGSDAIAGVINFITKKDFQGLEVQANYDRPQSAGGSSQSANFTWGQGDLKSDGYNIMVTADYNHQNDLTALQRSFSSYGYYPGLGYTSTNNPGSWPGTVVDPNGNAFQYGYPTCAGNTQLTTAPGDCAYRYSAATDLLPEHQEFGGMAAITKALPGNNQIQLQYFWTRSEVTDWSGPMFYEFQNGLLPTSPYYPTAGNLTCLGNSGGGGCTAPPDLGGPLTVIYTDPDNNRYSGNINLEQRLLLTFSGNNAGWDYGAAANYSENDNHNRNVGGYPNELVLAPGFILSPLINPFGPQSAAGQALINSSYVSGTYSLGSDKRWSVDGHVSKGLFTLPSATSPVTLAIGVDVEGEKFAEGTTGYNSIVTYATGLTDSATTGSRNSQAAFAELDIPVMKNLDFDLSDREDHYSDFGSTNNAKATVTYSPISAVKFRGSASTGFRAPTLFDLYSSAFLAASSSGTMGTGNPECNPNPTPPEWPANTCGTQGLGLYGGNAHLTPEKSKNYDFGVILSPVEDLGITLDYYRIVVTNVIGSVPETAIYGDPAAFGSLIHTATTGASAGTLTPSIAEAAECPSYLATSCGYIELGFSNTGELETNGVDVSVQYAQHSSIGTFHEDLEGNLVTEFIVQQYTGGPLLNTVGEFNELPPAYRWQHNLRVDWTSTDGKWNAGIANRYYSEYIDEFPDGAGQQRHVGAYSVYNGDISFKPIDQLTVLFGIKNILNSDPPATNAYQNNFAAGYNALVVDPLLRNFYVNVTYKIY